MGKGLLKKSIYKYIIIVILCALLIISYQFFDASLINNLISDSQEEINNKGLYPVFLIFLLRSVSIFIPIIPGTYCVVIAGYIYGIKTGLFIMFIADLFSCYSSFVVSRKLGRKFVKRILGVNQMHRVEEISQKYLENNFFLMTGFLMTSWFDFVCYAVGLTKISWKKFMPALIMSILISDVPFVAAGHALSQARNISINQVLSGDIDVINGPSLWLLIFSAIIIFGLGILNAFLNRRNKVN